jgi:hypothetical protein
MRPRVRVRSWFLGVTSALLATVTCTAHEKSAPENPGEKALDPADALLVSQQEQARKAWEDTAVPFIKTYCNACHSAQKRKGNITFQYAMKGPGSVDFRRLWQNAVANVQAGDMPPETADKQPSAEERAAFVKAITSLKYLSSRDPGTFVPRRLNRTEYGNTLHALLDIPASIISDLPEEVLGEGYLNSLSPSLMEQYLSITNAALKQACAPEGGRPTPALQRLFGDALTDPALSEEKTRNAITRLAKEAYRRPASPEEVDVLMRAYTLGRQKQLSPAASLQLALKAALLSPQFFFITPRSETEPKERIVPLDDHHLASRLSYFLWASPPDAELIALADAGKLNRPEALQAQLKRMIEDPRSRALFDGFASQWLGLNKLAEKTFDAQKFPGITPGLRAAMREEVRLLFEEILRENQSIRKFIQNDHTFLNQSLAALYGMENAIQGDAMRRVNLPSPNRGGILTMPGILASTSLPNRTSPVIRGVWVLEQILGEHVPPPPPNVPALEKQNQNQVAHLTLRQRTEMHRSNPVCANCHKILDPIGFGLENFDAIGRWRTQDESGAPIDPVGELPDGRRFTEPHELKEILAARLPEITRNLTAKMLAYALCRTLEGYDEIIVDGIAERVAADGYKMQTLVREIITSYPFTHRRTQP